jgi:PRTRC genetic system protein A
MAPHPFDVILQSSRPTLPVPLHGALDEMTEDGDRLLLASNGIFMEVRRPWVHARVRIAAPLPVAVPWGKTKGFTKLICGTPPQHLLQEFICFAKQVSPLECGAILTWREDGTWRLRILESEFASDSYLKFVRPALDEGEHFVVDVHSHGSYGAEFSRTDDLQDSNGELKIAGVYGFVSESRPLVSWRFCNNGLLSPAFSSIEVMLEAIN